MVHSGCFLERQYCAFSSTVRGQNSREFIARLSARGFARAIEPGPVRRGRLYHVHHKPLYEAISQADNRNRRVRTLGRMVERVMILDAVLGDRRCWWLSPEADKRRFFGLKRESWLQPEDYPHVTFGSGRQRTIRCFPDAEDPSPVSRLAMTGRPGSLAGSLDLLAGRSIARLFRG